MGNALRLFKKGTSILVLTTMILGAYMINTNSKGIVYANAGDVSVVDGKVNIYYSFDKTSDDDVVFTSNSCDVRNFIFPKDILGDTKIVVCFEDQKGNYYYPGEKIDISRYDLTSDTTIKIKVYYLDTINMNIFNPVTGDGYGQRMVKGYDLDSDKNISDIVNIPSISSDSVKDVNNKLANTSNLNISDIIDSLKDGDNPKISGKLSFDNTSYDIEYRNDEGDKENKQITSFSDAPKDRNFVISFRYFANVTIKDTNGDDVTANATYKVKYLDNLSNIDLIPKDNLAFQRWNESYDNLSLQNDGKWLLTSVAENTDLVAVFSEKVKYSFASDSGDEILKDYAKNVGKGSTINLPDENSKEVKSITPSGKTLAYYKDKDGNRYHKTIENISNDLILTPIFTDIINLTFQNESGNVIKKVGIGENVKLESANSIPKMTFKCWRDIEDNKDYYSGDCILVQKDTTIKPIYEATINYIDSDNTIIESKRFEIGEKIILPEVPKSKIEGYQFDSWYPSIEYAKENCDIQALYKKIKYTVIINGVPSQVEYGSDAILPTTAPVKQGYTFTGWSSDGKSVIKDTIIDPIFKINSYNVSFDGVNQSVKYGEAAMPPENPTKEGYIFAGCSEKYDNVCSNLDIKSIFVPRYLEVKVDGIVQKVQYGGNVLLPSVPVKEGYKFIGWNGIIQNIKEDGVVTSKFEKISVPSEGGENLDKPADVTPEKPDSGDIEKPGDNPEQKPDSGDIEKPGDNPEQKPSSGDTDKSENNEQQKPSDGNLQEPEKDDIVKPTGDLFNLAAMVIGVLLLPILSLKRRGDL